MKAKACCWVAALAVGLGITVRVQAVSTIQFTATSYTTNESDDTATLTVRRTGETNPEVGVDYATTDGTATNGLNYTAVAGAVPFGAGETNKTIVVPILNNGLVESPKNFRVILGNPTGGAVLGSRTNATVSITDNDFGIQFQFAASSTNEDGGMVVFGVVRGDDGTLADTHRCPESNHGPVFTPDHVLPGHAPQAGERVRPVRRRQPDAVAPGDPPAPSRRHR